MAEQPNADVSFPPEHPFEPDPAATWPDIYCKCGYDIDCHADKGAQIDGSGSVTR